MLYLRELSKNRFNVNIVSVNLDPNAIERIRARGLKAVLCRAEDLELPEKKVDSFTSFEMVERLHDPASFFRRLAKQFGSEKMLIALPYLNSSRVGLHFLRNRSQEKIYAEDEHIVELSPEDWTLLLFHTGWRVTYSEIYYQDPRKWPILSQLMGYYWRKRDYEGFCGALLQKDTPLSDYYQDRVK
jgi:hypothetical protein